MDEQKKCQRCGSDLAEKGNFFGGENICSSCLHVASEDPTHCPVCKSTLAEHEEVGLLLTPPGSTPAQKATAPEILILVCTKCGGIFFDKFHLNLLKGMMKSGV